MATPPEPAYRNFFQNRIIRMVAYWRDHSAIKELDIAILDAEREAILKAITLALDLDPAWSSLFPLITAFTPYMERRGYWDAWNTILQRAITTAQHQNDRDSEITLIALLARIYQRQSQPQQTIYHYRRAIRLARQAGNRFEEARACSNLGYLYIDEGHWWRSEVLSCHALAIFENLNSDHGRAHTHNHLGLLYTRQRKWDEAEQYLKQASHIWILMQDQHSLIYSFENLGSLYCDMESSNQAIHYLKKALEQVETTGEEAEIGNIWVNLGIAYRQKNDLTVAETYLQKAETLFKRMMNSFKLALVWNNLGVLKMLQGEWGHSEYYLNKSINTYRKLRSWKGETEVLIDYIENRISQKDFDQAYSSLIRLEELAAQYFNESQADYLKSLIKKYHRRLKEMKLNSQPT